MTPSHSHLFLDAEQHNLLMAAIASGSPMFMADQERTQHYSQGSNTENQHSTDLSVHGDITRPSSEFNFSNGISPSIDNLDYPLDLDGNFDFDLGDYGVDMDGKSHMEGITAASSSGLTEHEKRKSPPSEHDGIPSEPKRREKEGTEEKVAKKPGRKPLTSEPTTKRKAQNRAAQRAFRERKEKHLKDLEQKVEDLEKTTETRNKENTALRQEIDRLRAEVNEYRKRFRESQSHFSNILGKGSTGGFHFEFPMFGAHGRTVNANGNRMRASQGNARANGIRIGPGTLVERATSSSNASMRPISTYNLPASGAGRFSNTSQTASASAFSSYYTPSTSTSVSKEALGDAHFKESPMSHKADLSPSASSVSHHGTSSSVTSPESNTHSPLIYKQDHLEPVTEEEVAPIIVNEQEEPGFQCGLLDDGEASFCEKLVAISCGNVRHPIPLDPDSDLLPKLNDIIPRPDPTLLGLRNGEKANGGLGVCGSNYDSVLFNDYRDPMDQTNVDLNMSFFDDAFPLTDFSPESPNVPSTPVPEREPEVKKSLPAGLADADELGSSSEDEADEKKAAERRGAGLMSCNKIWDRISSHPKFASGELDMDHLCSLLRSKARCSEAGVVVGQQDFEEVLDQAGLRSRDILLEAQ